MEEKEKDNSNDKKEVNNNKKVSLKVLIVLAVLAIFAIGTIISLRANYLKTIEINTKYENVFYENIKNKYIIFGVVAFILYICTYILNRFIRRGLKKFFDEEKKDLPKLPNKSISLIFAIIGGLIATAHLSEKFAIFQNGALFGKGDPIFNTDIGYYMFTLPFIQALLIFIMEVLVFAIVYTAIYYVITFNVYFDGIDGEMLKKNTFIKQELFIVILITIIFSTYIFIGSQNILTGNMVTIGDELSTELTGAGKTDVTIKLWGYRILSFVIIIAVLRLMKYIKKQNFKQGVISVLIVPVYLIGMFLIMIYSDTIHLRNNELDKQQEYIGYNIKNTKIAYGINIDQQNINSYNSITADQVAKNEDIINNIPTITEEVTLNAISEHQENSVYYDYKNTFLSLYNIGEEDRLVYITPREILSDSTISYNNRTLKYTHGYSAVVSTANDNDSDGYAEYILSDFTSQDVLNIKQPRIYYGLQTDSTVLVNTSFGKEYDYPITPSTNAENVYDGNAGLKLGFLDKLAIGISEGNIRLAFSSNVTEDTKILINRNIIERAKTILPDILYDEEPYLVITDEGKLVWVLDGYTTSNAYPYSQMSTITVNGSKEKINYIRNSVKVLIDAYDGTTTFYITDTSDPIIMTYRKMYPGLFVEDDLPKNIKEHLVYPKLLYNVQAKMISKYHDISEDTLYRADDIWQITTKASTTNSTVAGIEMEPYYTMMKTNGSNGSKLGLFLAYNKYGKQNITSYLVGMINDGKAELSLYKFNSESNVAGIMQLNNQIEQDTTIKSQLDEINTSGTRLLKDMIIVPIDNTLLYVEPIYQVMLNGDSNIPVLKKVIVASGNIVAIGDNLNKALTNLFNDDYSIDLEFIDVEDINALIDSVIKANNNLQESLDANDFEMIGKDISRLQTLINQLQTARQDELEKEKENEQNQNEVTNELSGNVQNEILNNTVLDNSVANQVNEVK